MVRIVGSLPSNSCPSGNFLAAGIRKFEVQGNLGVEVLGDRDSFQIFGQDVCALGTHGLRLRSPNG